MAESLKEGRTMFYNPSATNVSLEDYKKEFKPSVYLKNHETKISSEIQTPHDSSFSVYTKAS